jgi:hypothetical protein
MSRHAQPHPSGGWLSLALAVVAALGGASIASNVAAGPGRVAIGWASLLAAALFLLHYRSERQSSLRLARIDHARRRDAVRLREEIAEAHHRSRIAVERSYVAVARAEALAAEVNRLMATLASTPAASAVHVLPVMTPAPVVPAPAAPIADRPASPKPLAAKPAAARPVEPRVEPRPVARPVAPAAASSATSLDLPLVASKLAPARLPVAPLREAPFASPSEPAEKSKIDLRPEPVRGFARGA